jgi:cysteinyl-tRNA synthetase
LDGQKMSKSKGNLVLVQDLLGQFSPAAIRLMCLNRVRETPWSFTSDLLEDATSLLDDLYAAAAKPAAEVSPELADALLSDLDVAGAVAVGLREGGATARELIDVLALS